MRDILRVGLVGAGAVGSRRAAVINEDPSAALVLVGDVDRERAVDVATRWGSPGCRAVADWADVVQSRELDIVIVSTINQFLAPIGVAALEGGKHVLCEKPMARSLGEAARLSEAARVAGKVLKIGFNHRFHPAIQEAYRRCAAGEIGALHFARCVYGHGGRPGYESEWRLDPQRSGGGELLDQGIHAVDLFRWFLGEFVEAFGFVATYVWSQGAGVEDNAFALFRTARGQTASLHVSWTQWKNQFCFEVFGQEGYCVVEGLGGSYGPQRLRVGQRAMEGGPPAEEVVEYPGPDVSWAAEWREFAAAIRENRVPLGSGHDGLEAMKMVQSVYESARTRRLVNL